MKSIPELQSVLLSIGKKVSGTPRPNGLFLMPESPTHTGAPHAEIINGEYHYVITERGSEFERRIAQSEDELLYWFMADSVFSIACSWEVQNRKENEDFRRQLFAKQIELLKAINLEWAAEKAKYHDRVLEKNPFTS